MDIKRKKKKEKKRKENPTEQGLEVLTPAKDNILDYFNNQGSNFQSN